MANFKVGDVVMVVRCDHKCAMHYMGRIGIVTSVPEIHPGVACYVCGEADIAKPNEYIVQTRGNTSGGTPSRWLAKFDGLQESTTESRELERTE